MGNLSWMINYLILTSLIKALDVNNDNQRVITSGVDG